MKIKQKPSLRGSVLANAMWGGCSMSRGNPIGVGYTKVEVVGVCNWMAHKGGGGWGAEPKTEPPGLGFG